MTQIKYPQYFIVGDRPVALQKTDDGGLTCLAYNWDTGNLERNMSYYLKVSNMEGEIDEVSEEVFNQKVEQLQNQLNKE
ncbi:MAG: hypothetical protein HC815_05690 [Richelia sp. RM1_1_1]|nr:hypothetical protein [Richelia sp. RM1_1_1]